MLVGRNAVGNIQDTLHNLIRDAYQHGARPRDPVHDGMLAIRDEPRQTALYMHAERPWTWQDLTNIEIGLAQYRSAWITVPRAEAVEIV